MNKVAALIACVMLALTSNLRMTTPADASSGLPIATKDPGVEEGWRAWRTELSRRCPSHHVDWICDDCYDDLLAGFDQALSPRVQQRVAMIADYHRRCAMEVGGFSCEMGVSLEAYRALGQLGKFAAYGCSRYKCEAAAICTEINRGAARHH